MELKSGSTWAIRVAAFLAMTAATAAAAWWLGTAYAHRRIQTESAATRAEWDRMLATDTTGISVGRPFPSFRIWTTGVSPESMQIREVLPHGGVLIAVSPSCHVCIDVAGAFDEAMDALPGAACPIAVVLEGESSGALTEELHKRFSDLPFYDDPDVTLNTVYRIVENPTYFVLDENGVVLYAGFGQRSVEELIAILDTYCSPRKSSQSLEGS